MGGKSEINKFLPLQCLADRSCLLLMSVSLCGLALMQSPQGRDRHLGQYSPRPTTPQGPGPAEPMWGRPACLKRAQNRLGLQIPRRGHECWGCQALAV